MFPSSIPCWMSAMHCSRVCPDLAMQVSMKAPHPRWDKAAPWSGFTAFCAQLQYTDAFIWALRPGTRAQDSDRVRSCAVHEPR